MNVIKGKGPIYDPGLCRCCGTMKKCRILNVEYESFGQKEVYSDMIMDCFGLLISYLDGKPTERLICATCVKRLREAAIFKKQVLQCEEAFLQMKVFDTKFDSRIDLSKIEVEVNPPIEMSIVKVEPVSMDSECGSPACDEPMADEPYEEPLKNDPVKHDSSSDDAPLQRLASHPPKKAPKKVVQKLPISKVQQMIRERDPSYTTESNVLTIVEWSYACPFKCRHNHLLCYYCGQDFADPELLRAHTELVHDPKRFKIVDYKNMIKIDLHRIDCRLCPEKIDSLDQFKEHITTVHNKKYYFKARETVLPFKLTKDEIKCALCDASFPYFHALNKHMNIHYSNFVCESCGLGFVDRGRFVMHQLRHEQGDFPCPSCGKTFRAQYNRDLHIDRVHKKRGRVYCPKCDVTLMSYHQKLKHLVEVHGEKPLSFSCNMCERVFDTRRTLTIHRRKDHLKDYRYECQCCGQKFFTRFALNNHMPTHTGERNHKCKVCEKTYPRLKTLKDHMRIHTNDRRYRCHICGQAFIQNCSLKGHMKSQHPEYG